MLISFVRMLCLNCGELCERIGEYRIEIVSDISYISDISYPDCYEIAGSKPDLLVSPIKRAHKNDRLSLNPRRFQMCDTWDTGDKIIVCQTESLSIRT